MVDCNEEMLIASLVEAFAVCKNKACAWVNGDENAQVEVGGVQIDSIRRQVEKIRDSFSSLDKQISALYLNLFFVGTWETDKEYKINNLVINEDIIYRCISPHTSDMDFYTDLDAHKWVIQNNSDASSVTYTSLAPGSVLRTVQERLMDIVSLKDFGAVGDGVTDDTIAWNLFQTAESGIKYIPAGQYLINEKIHDFQFGCFGNGTDWEDFKNGFPKDTKFYPEGWKPLIRHHVDYPNYESFGPIIALSFDAYNQAAKASGRDGASGPQGISVKSRIKGEGNAMQCNIKSYAVNELVGSGDCVAISGAVQKREVEGGTSMACAVTCVCEQYSTQSGVVMAHEVGPKQMVEPAYNPNSLPTGACVGQHLRAASPYPPHAMSLYIGPSDDSGEYGARNAIQIGRTFFNMPDGYAGAEGTTALNCYGWDSLHHPEKAMLFGHCPAHIQMRSGYQLNIKSGTSNFKNLTDGGTVYVTVDQQGDTALYGYLLKSDGTTTWRIVSGGTGRLLLESPQEDTNGNSPAMIVSLKKAGVQTYTFTASHDAIYPGTTNETISCGKPNAKFSQVYAATGSISTSDERLKRDISPIDERVFAAWAEVEFVQYRFIQTFEEKGEAARYHIGLIAQKIQQAFEKHEVDPFSFGLLCYDEWPAEPVQYETERVCVQAAEYDDNDELISEEVYEERQIEIQSKKEAGYIYSVRYEEALSLEAAYQRWLLNKLIAKMGISVAQLLDK